MDEEVDEQEEEGGREVELEVALHVDEGSCLGSPVLSFSPTLGSDVRIAMTGQPNKKGFIGSNLTFD